MLELNKDFFKFQQMYGLKGQRIGNELEVKIIGKQEGDIPGLLVDCFLNFYESFSSHKEIKIRSLSSPTDWKDLNKIGVQYSKDFSDFGVLFLPVVLGKRDLEISSWTFKEKNGNNIVVDGLVKYVNDTFAFYDKFFSVNEINQSGVSEEFFLKRFNKSLQSVHMIYDVLDFMFEAKGVQESLGYFGEIRRAQTNLMLDFNPYNELPER